jgi:acyl-CoA thioesterase
MTDHSKSQILAEKVSAIIGERDTAARMLGISVDRVAPGFARLSMSIRDDMLNGAGICHGGLSYTLADTAFAHACNSYNRLTVAQSCSISYPAAAKRGDRLTAECREVLRQGRSGVYDCTVTNQDGTVVALFRGQSRTISGHFVEGTE